MDGGHLVAVLPASPLQRNLRHARAPQTPVVLMVPLHVKEIEIR